MAPAIRGLERRQLHDGGRIRAGPAPSQPPPAAACQPRPPVAGSVVPSGAGRLQVTLAASASSYGGVSDAPIDRSPTTSLRVLVLGAHRRWPGERSVLADRG